MAGPLKAETPGDREHAGPERLFSMGEHGNTRERVQSPLVVLPNKKYELGGDFFYGKTGYAYHSEGL